jgi:hypothetical protein
MGSISTFCERMRYWCEDGNLGYDQSNRWDIREGGECDCSSLVIFALREAGFDTGTASYTGDMSDNLTARGWQRIPFSSTSQVRAGDILLNDLYHVCAVISGSGSTATIAQASIDERGRATGGQSGDQANETNTKQVYVYSRGWDCILRYTGADDGGATPTDGKLAVDGVLGKLSVSEWQRQVGTTVNGVVSGQLEECKGSYPALDSVTYEGTGSELMLAVQKLLGVPNPTGVIASGTVSMLQGWLYLHGYSCAADKAGVLGDATAKELQQSLNDGKWES